MIALAIFRGYFRQLWTTNLDYFGLRQSFYKLTITSEARYREHYNINEHPRHPAGYIRNFRPLSMTSSACIIFHINLLLLRTRAICEHYKINEHPRNPSGYFR